MKREKAARRRGSNEITLRPVADADAEFVYQVYASTRTEELAPLNWSAAEQDAFLRMQFDLRQRDYAARLDPSGHQIILRDDKAVGVIWVSRDRSEIRLADLSLLPAHRGKGLGTRLVRQLIDESERTGKPVRLMVWKMNEQALRLYRQLGFEVAGDTGVHFKLERRPDMGFGAGKSNDESGD
jgi:ribosomal protein S18 acetylase RimI-like enzyme